LGTTTVYQIPAKRLSNEGEPLRLEIQTFKGPTVVILKKDATEWEEGIGLWVRKVGRWVPDKEPQTEKVVDWDRVAIDCSQSLNERYHVVDRDTVLETRDLPSNAKKSYPAEKLSKIEKLCYHLALEMIGEHTDLKIGNRTAKQALFSSDETGFSIEITWKGHREKKEKMLFSSSGMLLSTRHENS
jgi:hypothetical protein